jgi:ergothioneine biosynthesis protein EgtB
MTGLLDQADTAQREIILQRCELGLHHEQQHQELLCSDIKYSFSFNPLYPSLGRERLTTPAAAQEVLDFTAFESTEAVIGCDGGSFHFDIEAPAHRVHVPAFRLANRLITNAEYQVFMQDSGYTNPELWLADGWLWKESTAAVHPRYWVQQDGDWFEYTLHGLRPLHPDLPVSHVNYYEADACARWFGKRLPDEQEWEAACRQLQLDPGHADITLHPHAAGAADGPVQMFGSLWQWTRSSFSPYPGFRPAAGAIGEYNGKFMCNQLVLRGSSCVTPPGHARPSYRNFFYPKDQWQFTGIRLAEDA